MSAPQHTPGPWRADAGGFNISGPKGEWLADLATRKELSKRAADTREANARLIAAAPVMHDALMQTRDYFTGAYATEADRLAEQARVFGLIRAALAKVTP